MKNKKYSFADTFPFGKHKDKKIIDIIENDFNYMVWVMNNNVLSLDEEVIDLIEEAISEIPRDPDDIFYQDLMGY